MTAADDLTEEQLATIPSVEILGPLEHQEPIDESPAMRKLARWGRRAGKTRWAFKAAMNGHGPEGRWTRTVRDMVVDRWEGRKLRGVAHGFDVAWIARDYKQANAIWSEEILPRFKGVQVIKIHETDRWLEIPGAEDTASRLWIRSAENIASIRGAGAKLIGVIIDEAAHMDLEAHLKDVVYPMLLDNGGWLVLMSTTNGGLDGNKELRLPSYFNILCQETMDGKRKGWEHFYATAFDNPMLDPEDIEDLIEEYGDDEFRKGQEIYAHLLRGGEGLAFPEFNSMEGGPHVKRMRVPGHWWWGVGLDWGYSSPGWAGGEAYGPDGISHLKWELPFKNKTPYQAGWALGAKMFGYPKPEMIVYDSEMDSTGDGRGGIREPLREPFQKGLDDFCKSKGVDSVPMMPAAKGRGSRLARKMAQHEDFRIRNHGPNFTVDPSCKAFIASIAGLTRDPNDPENADTKGNDHAYDGRTYLRITRRPRVPRVPKKPTREHENRHPGIKSVIKEAPRDSGRRTGERRRAAA